MRNRPTIVVAVLLLLCAVWFVLRPSSIRSQPILEGTAKPAKSQRTPAEWESDFDENHSKERFHGLPSKQHDLVERMERHYLAWIANHANDSPFVVEDWLKESRDFVSRLKRDDIEALAVWLLHYDSPFVTEAAEFEQALWWQWGRLDGDAAIGVMLKEIRMEGDSVGLDSLSSAPSFARVMEDHVFHLLSGYSQEDPGSAWLHFENLNQNHPRFANKLVAKEIMRNWAGLSAGEARKTVFEQSGCFASCLSGYLEGIRDVENWEDFIQSIASEAEDKDYFADSPPFWFMKEAAECWFFQQPDEALEWYSTNMEYTDAFANRDGMFISFEGIVPEEPEARLRIAESVANEIIFSRGREGYEHLVDWFAASIPNHTGVAGEVLSRTIIANPEDPLAQSLYHFVPQLPEDEAAHVYRALIDGPERQIERNDRSTLISAESIAYFHAVSELGEQLDLPAELRIRSVSALDELIHPEVSKDN